MPTPKAPKAETEELSKVCTTYLSGKDYTPAVDAKNALNCENSLQGLFSAISKLYTFS
jgi:hypothetical protein